MSLFSLFSWTQLDERVQSLAPTRLIGWPWPGRISAHQVYSMRPLTYFHAQQTAPISAFVTTKTSSALLLVPIFFSNCLMTALCLSSRIQMEFTWTSFHCKLFTPEQVGFDFPSTRYVMEMMREFFFRRPTFQHFGLHFSTLTRPPIGFLRNKQPPHSMNRSDRPPRYPVPEATVGWRHGSRCGFSLRDYFLYF